MRVPTGAVAAGALLLLVALTAGATALLVDGVPGLLRVVLAAGAVWGGVVAASSARTAR